MSGTPRPIGLRKLHSKNGLCQATGADALVQAKDIGKIGATLPEKVGHRAGLVVLALEVGREAAPGDATRDLG
jgi:hypothetical protein